MGEEKLLSNPQQNKLTSLETRVFKYKRTRSEFFCPLCRTQRAFLYSPYLTIKNYIQIFLLTIFSAAILNSTIGFKAVVIFFPIWLGFEFFVRVMHRKEVPCPHCGFDASWYKRDVVKARTIVEEFWKKQNVQTAQSSDVKESAEDVYENPVMYGDGDKELSESNY